jgi:hypothetical protein
MGGAASSAASSSSSGLGRGPAPSLPRPQATVSQRKQQMTQLAELGISIPDEFRPDLAMAGEWQVTSERVIEPEEGEKRPEALALGVRKRQADEEDEDELEAKKRRWGSHYKSHPIQEDDGNLDALLSDAAWKGKPEVKNESKDGVKKEQTEASFILDDKTTIKTEASEEELAIPTDIPGLEDKTKQDDAVAPGIVFKKRKAKHIRQK